MYQLSMLLIEYLLLTIINPTRGNPNCQKELCSCCRSGTCTDPDKHVQPCDGCIDGYTGPSCYEPCPSGCANCSQFFFQNKSEEVCHRCKNGFYNGKYKDIDDYPLLQDCSWPCIENCEKCTSYYTCSRCKPQFYIADEKSCIRCAENCLQCTSESKCLACKDRHIWDGKLCAACPAHCIHCTSGSDCPACGYFWNGVECVTCEAGYFGSNCSARCPEHCNDCSSNDFCDSCTAGFMGVTCQNKCPDCKSGTECNQVTGYCFASCKNGFSGEHCNLPCHSNCSGCERENPDTCVSCASDRYGLEINCIFSCSMNCVNGTCSDTDGKCTHGCEHGYWGDTCERNCSKYCLKKCNSTDSPDTYTCVESICDRKTGRCLNVCLPGISGSDCSMGPENEEKNSPWPAVLAVSVLALCAGVCYILIRKGFRVIPLQWAQTRMTTSVSRGRRWIQRTLDLFNIQRNNDPRQNSEETEESFL